MRSGVHRLSGLLGVKKQVDFIRGRKNKYTAADSQGQLSVKAESFSPGGHFGVAPIFPSSTQACWRFPAGTSLLQVICKHGADRTAQPHTHRNNKVYGYCLEQMSFLSLLITKEANFTTQDFRKKKSKSVHYDKHLK